MPRPKKAPSAPFKRAIAPTTKVANIRDWMTQQAHQDLLRFITCGSVDDGKSTLIGRLLWESHQVFDDQLTALQLEKKFL